MKVALYARVSTLDKDQDPEVQLSILRKASNELGWEIYREYIDHAPATDLYHRVQWRSLMDAASHASFGTLFVWKIDRAFRSVKDMVDTLEALKLGGVTFRSFTDPIDTGTAMGSFALTILTAAAGLELSLISERVRAGMAHAKAKGMPLGRPTVYDLDPGLTSGFASLLPMIRDKKMTKAAAARHLGISHRTLNRMIANVEE